MEKISIVIPCYNSQNYIRGVVDEIVDTIKERYDYEIILVNDGSTQELWDAICELADKYKPRIRGIRFAKNFGQHAALLAGYRASVGDVVIQMDDDGQCDPKGIFILLDKMKEGYDVVFARYPEAKKTLFRKLGSEFNRRMCIAMLDMPKELKPMSFSAARRYVVDEMIRYDRPYPYIGGLIFRSTRNMCDVEIEHRERKEGESNYNLIKLFKLWLNGFTAFSVKPLEMASVAGAVCALFGIIFAIIIIVRKVMGISVLIGWSSMICIMLILGGMNLLMLGLVGEYIGRIYICLNNAPQYVIRDVYGNVEE